MANTSVSVVETQDLVNWAKTNLPNSLGTQALLVAPPQSYPTSGFQTVSQITGSAFPLPAGLPPNLNALGTANINYTVPRNGYQWNLRGDYYLHQSDRFYVETLRTTATTERVTPRPALNNRQFTSSDFVNADWTHTFSPRLLNEAGASMIRPYSEDDATPAMVIPFVNVTGSAGFSNWSPRQLYSDHRGLA